MASCCRSPGPAFAADTWDSLTRLTMNESAPMTFSWVRWYFVAWVFILIQRRVYLDLRA